MKICGFFIFLMLVGSTDETKGRKPVYTYEQGDDALFCVNSSNPLSYARVGIPEGNHGLNLKQLFLRAAQNESVRDTTKGTSYDSRLRINGNLSSGACFILRNVSQNDHGTILRISFKEIGKAPSKMDFQFILLGVEINTTKDKDTENSTTPVDDRDVSSNGTRDVGTTGTSDNELSTLQIVLITLGVVVVVAVVVVGICIKRRCKRKETPIQPQLPLSNSEEHQPENANGTSKKDVGMETPENKQEEEQLTEVNRFVDHYTGHPMDLENVESWV